MMHSRKRVLVVHGLRRNGRSTIEHVVKSFAGFENTHETLFANVFGEGPNSEMSFDLMVVTAEVLALRSSQSWKVLEVRLKNWRSRSTRLVLMPQDEYTDSQSLECIANRLNADVIFGPCAHHYDRLLPGLSPNIVREALLPGYRSPYLVDSLHHFSKDAEERTYDVVQRVSRLGPQFGSAGALKADYALTVKAFTEGANLRANISTDSGQTLSGDLWFDFLSSGRWTPTTKGGSSINDRTGSIAILSAYSQSRSSKQNGRFEKLLRTIDETDSPYVADSPRIFEAACLGVGLIMPTDSYIGNLLPNEDYLPFEYNDLNNLDAIVSKIKDRSFLRHVTQSAYEKLISNPKLSQEYVTAEIIGASPREFLSSSTFNSVEGDKRLAMLFELESSSRRKEVRDQILYKWVSKHRSSRFSDLSKEEEQIAIFWIHALNNGLPIGSITAKWIVPA